MHELRRNPSLDCQILRILASDVRDFFERGLARRLRSQVAVPGYDTQGARRALPAEVPGLMGSSCLTAS